MIHHCGSLSSLYFLLSYFGFPPSKSLTAYRDILVVRLVAILLLISLADLPELDKSPGERSFYEPPLFSAMIQLFRHGNAVFR